MKKYYEDIQNEEIVIEVIENSEAENAEDENWKFYRCLVRLMEVKVLCHLY